MNKVNVNILELIKSDILLNLYKKRANYALFCLTVFQKIVIIRYNKKTMKREYYDVQNKNYKQIN